MFRDKAIVEYKLKLKSTDTKEFANNVSQSLVY